MFQCFFVFLHVSIVCNKSYYLLSCYLPLFEAQAGSSLKQQQGTFCWCSMFLENIVDCCPMILQLSLCFYCQWLKLILAVCFYFQRQGSKKNKHTATYGDRNKHSFSVYLLLGTNVLVSIWKAQNPKKNQMFWSNVLVPKPNGPVWIERLYKLILVGYYLQQTATTLASRSFHPRCFMNWENLT